MSTLNASIITTESIILDGTNITASGEELNFVEGVTSSIQTQLDALATTQDANTWIEGTSTDETLVSPEKIKAAIESLAPTIGDGQTWQDFNSTRLDNTVYQNSTGRSIMVSIVSNWNGSQVDATQVSSVSSSGPWVGVGRVVPAGDFSHTQFIVPNGHWYRNVGTFAWWAELR